MYGKNLNFTFFSPEHRKKKAKEKYLCRHMWLYIRKEPKVHKYIAKVIHMFPGHVYKIAPRDPFQTYIL